MTKQRNPFACAPIMRKGGVHTQSKTGQRRSDKNRLSDEVDTYLEELEQTQKNRIIGKPDDSAYKKKASDSLYIYTTQLYKLISISNTAAKYVFITK